MPINMVLQTIVHWKGPPFSVGCPIYFHTLILKVVSVRQEINENVTEMTLQTCSSPWLRQWAMPDAAFKPTCYGSKMFLHYCGKYQKLYKLKKFYSVRRWRWTKLLFFKIQIFWYFTRILCRIKSLYRVIIVLPCTWWKIEAVFVNPNVTSKIDTEMTPIVGTKRISDTKW